MDKRPKTYTKMNKYGVLVHVPVKEPEPPKYDNTLKAQVATPMTTFTSMGSIRHLPNNF